MYFEDVFNKAKKYWTSPIKVGEVGKFYMENVEGKHRIEDIPISDWIDVIGWSIGIILTEKEKTLGKGFVRIDDISVIDVEERFKDDLKHQLTDEMFKEYKGFRYPPL